MEVSLAQSPSGQLRCVIVRRLLAGSRMGVAGCYFPSTGAPLPQSRAGFEVRAV
jgi:hypothetical protein